MKTRDVIVNCENGLHMRVAADVIKVVRNHDATVHLACGDCRKANACSMMELMCLGAERGAKIRIVAEGRDEDEVTRRLSDYFEEGGGI